MAGRSTEPDASGQRISRGLAWIGLGSALIGVLDLAAQILILHFFLSPAEYGVAALVTTLFPFLDQATNMGLASAVIQRDDHSPDKISTVFWLNVLLSVAMFGALALVAPVYARWQGHPVIGPMLLAYGGKLLFQNVYSIPVAMMKRELRFKELSLIRIIANVAEFGAKVGLAAMGWSSWCFVVAALVSALIVGVGVQLRHPWRPGLVFRPREASAYARFGVTTSASQLLFYLYTNADYPVVSKLFGATALGLYRAAYELVLELVRTIAGVFIEMGFPTFARLRADRARVTEQFIAFTRQALVAIVPVVVVIFIAAEETLTVVWGPAYAQAATAARILCIVAVLRGLSHVVPPLLDGIGRPSLTLIYHAFAAIALPALFVICGLELGPSYGYGSVALAWAIGYPMALAILLVLAFRQLGLSPFLYLRRTLGIPGCAVLAWPAGWGVHVLTSGWPALPRLIAVAIASLVVFSTLLARLQGISVRTIWRSIKP